MWTSIRSLDRVLKGEATRTDDAGRTSIDVPLGGLSLVILLLGAVYGACMGVFAVTTRWGTPKAAMGYQQLLASAVKVPALFFLTLLVTLPSLYVFNALVGSRLTLGAVVRLLVSALGVMMALLASFGTIVVFFTLSTTSYAFMVLLNVLLFAVSGFLGLGFLLQTLHRLSLAQRRDDALARVAAGEAGTAGDVTIATPGEGEVGAGGIAAAAAARRVAAGEPPALAPPLSAPPGHFDRTRGPAEHESVKNVFRIWVIVFGLVGAQMSWMLRPFIGDPRADFTLFRQRESNFFQAVAQKVGEMFEGDRKGAGRGN